MAHTVRSVALGGNTALAQITFTSYTAGQGGESFTLAEFGLTGSLVDVWFLQTIDALNRAANALLVQYKGGGKVQLQQPGFPGIVNELPTTPSMSFTIFAIIQGT